MATTLQSLGRNRWGMSFRFTFFIALQISFSVFGGTDITVLASLSNATGRFPEARMIQGVDGGFYGTALVGGTNGQLSGFGTVFRVTTNGTISTLVHFANTNGSHPAAGLIQGRDGSLYGTTYGETVPMYNLGTVFRITTNGLLTTLVTFTGANGSRPECALIVATDGNLYGTTLSGGTNGGYGTVFQLSTNGMLKTLVSFGNTNGASPASRLLQGSDGFLYGTTTVGGAFGFGTVFKLTTNGNFTSLVSFDNTNGARPFAGLIEGSDGFYYGTTREGGTNGGHGTVFKMSSAGILIPLAAFNGTNGSQSYGEIVEGFDGNFYGTTPFGSVSNFGNVFMMTPNGILTELVQFVGTNGARSYAGLLQASDGDFYGTTGNGGVNGGGTVFRFPMPFALQNTSQTSGFFSFTWDAAVGRSYQIQSKTDVSSPNWFNYSPALTATDATMASGNLATTNATEFFRAVLLP